MTQPTQDSDWLDRVEALFLRYGIKSITMDDVASDLGISKKTLYQMVESKDDLVVKVLSNHITRGKSLCSNITHKAANAIDEIFFLLESNSQEMAQMKTNIVYDLQKYHRQAWEMIRKFQYDFVYKVVRDNLMRGRREGLYRENFDIDIIARLHLATSFSIFDPDIFPDGQPSKMEVLNEYILHYLHGIVSPKGLIYLKMKLS